MKLNTILICAIAATVIFSGCEKDKNKVENPPVINEEELITTLKVKLVNGTDTTSFQFKDVDGDGGMNGTVDTLKLKAGQIYSSDLQFLNESNPASIKNITEEIKDEAVDHLICYTANSNIGITITDKDGNNLPLGITSNWAVGNAGTGSLTVRLRHQPGIKSGDCGVGETDIEIVFPVIIK